MGPTMAFGDTQFPVPTPDGERCTQRKIVAALLNPA